MPSIGAVALGREEPPTSDPARPALADAVASSDTFWP